LPVGIKIGKGSVMANKISRGNIFLKEGLRYFLA
jgi:hypothetical protein